MTAVDVINGFKYYGQAKDEKSWHEKPFQINQNN